MNVKIFVQFLIAVFFAVFGAFIFYRIGFPVAPLTGAATAITLICLMGLNVELPNPIRNAVILVLGINIGSSVTPEVLQGAVKWPISLGIMVICVLSVMWVSRYLMEHIFKFDYGTALLASAPGHLSYVLSLGVETGRDVGPIAIIQTVRVLCLTLFVPPLIGIFFGSTNISVLPSNIISGIDLLGIIGVAIPVALILQFFSIPAAWLLAGMIVSALGHAIELSPGRLPDFLGDGALLMMGMLIGSRFATMPMHKVFHLILPGIVMTIVAIAISLLAVGLCLLILGGQAALYIIAFAPGGVEAMAAIALALGYDPTFVAAHHVFRLVILSIIMPIAIHRIGLRD